jgi:hypothetical protein
MRSTDQLFQMLRDGDRLSTEELVYLQERLRILCNLSREFGPCMDMVVSFLSPKLEAVEGYISYRKEKEKEKKNFTLEAG